VVAGRTSLADLVALVASARLVVSGDTGVSHLASAFARPSVTLFGPVPPAEWGPPHEPRHQVLWAGRPGYRGDPHGLELDPALAAITPDQVSRAAVRALHAAGLAAPVTG
jgi:ADP-heptose:LPS heptosyltransferase